jgi:ABC-type multidrug transport system fused ATPase/permease subunit
MSVSFRRIASLAIPEIPMLAFAMIMLLLSSAMLLVVPVLFGLIIQSIRTNDHDTLMKAVYAWVLGFGVLLTHTCRYGLLIAAGGGGIAVMLRALGFQLAGQRVVARLRIDLFKSIIRQDVSFFDSNKV